MKILSASVLKSKIEKTGTSNQRGKIDKYSRREEKGQTAVTVSETNMESHNYLTELKEL